MHAKQAQADRPLGGFIAWLLTHDGGRALAQGMARATTIACKAAGVTLADLKRRLDTVAMRRLVDCVAEDLAGRVGPGGATYADAYLASVGADRHEDHHMALRALRDSGMSLYLVIKVQPGLGFVAEDLLFPGPTIQVVAPAAAREFVGGDMLCARLLRQGGVTAMSDGYVALAAHTGWRLKREMETLFAIGRADAPPRLEAEVVRANTALMMNAWLAAKLDERAPAEPLRRSA